MIGVALYEMGFEYVEDGNVWCTHVADGKTVEIHTMGHGISGFVPAPDEIAVARAEYDKGQFRVIHFSTTDGERKGTIELVQAWAMLTQYSTFPKDAELWLVLDHHANVALQARLRDIALSLPRGVRVLPRGDMNAATMSRVLCRMHLVATPSRGEGFGLFPLSSRACGVPVATTATTGHSAGHAEGPGVVTIPQPEELAPIDDGPGAMAPPVLPFDIAQAIAFAHGEWPALSALAEAHAGDVARVWSWENQLAPLMELLR
jgi:glycosyltransferase involved in cell wall biosynthesis